MSFQPAFHPDAAPLRLADFNQFHDGLTVGTFERVTAEIGFETFAPGEEVEGFSEGIKVRGHKNLYNGDWVYWTKRRGQQPGLSKRVATLFKRQKDQYAHCGLYFKLEDKLENDYIIPKSRGGHDGYHNWQLLHAHCHHQKTAKEKELRQLEALMSAANQARSRVHGDGHTRF
jgi:Zn-finger protein